MPSTMEASAIHDLISYIATYSTLGVVLWGAIHTLQRLTRLRDRPLAIIVIITGIVGGLIAQGIGLVPGPAAGAWSWLASAFFGMVAALAGAAPSDLNMARAVIAPSTSDKGD